MSLSSISHVQQKQFQHETFQNKVCKFPWVPTYLMISRKRPCCLALQMYFNSSRVPSSSVIFEKKSTANIAQTEELRNNSDK